MGKNVINSKENKEEKKKILQNADVLISLFKKYLNEKEGREEFFFTSVGYAVMYILYTAGDFGKETTWEERADKFIEFLERIKEDMPKLETYRERGLTK